MPKLYILAPNIKKYLQYQGILYWQSPQPIC